MKRTLLLLSALIATHAFSQTKPAPLTVDKIMRDPKWIGTSPSALSWTADGKQLLFSWNPEKAASDSQYYITPSAHTPQKTDIQFRRQVIGSSQYRYNANRTKFTYTHQGDIYWVDVKNGAINRITQTEENEFSPVFSFNDSRIVYTRGNNLFSFDPATGLTTQLTNFRASSPSEPVKPKEAAGDKWLETQSLANSVILQERRKKTELADSTMKSWPKEKELRVIGLDGRSLSGTSISADGRFISYRLSKAPVGVKNTIVPSYVTESGFTEDLAARSKVGSPQGTQEFFVFDTKQDTVFAIKTDSIPGIKDLPDYLKDYPAVFAEKQKKPAVRPVYFSSAAWSPGNEYAVLDVRSQDNKDRWLLLLNGTTGKYSLLDRQRDEAWIGGPGTGSSSLGWLDDKTIWFQSEATGYSHLYTLQVFTKTKKALTSGQWEVQSAQLSRDKKYFYLTTNEVHPGEQHFYRLSINGGNPEKLTTMTGANMVTLSPDEKWLGILHSYSNKPWELYIQENKPGGKPKQVTHLAQSDEFKSYPWRDPELITFTARDGAKVYARLYRPANPHPSKPGVIFVHGAGYLQNVHKWWSSYFREYMFHNLLADSGYTVLDIDYRGSSGYGRDWRTGIYRHMGGKDLSDQVDGAKYMVEQLGVNPQRIGLYGGSYGGFITLMAMFNHSDVFSAGAALRSVTDWAHYNHGYTSNILNEPVTDSIAYQRSSPINFAQGLKGHLLMCHGMIDVNVHFQDIVRITQRLIELGKDNWELAVYPVEDHGFVEPSSWADEYKRIFKLFQTQLKK